VVQTFPLLQKSWLYDYLKVVAMLSIDQKALESHGLLKTGKVQVPMDDYVLHMVLKKGRIVSSARKPIYVEAIDIAEHDGHVHSFKMSMVEAFQLCDNHPEFVTGLVGSWRLLGSTGQVKLIKAFEERDPELVKAFLLSKESHALALDRYAEVLSVGTKETL